MSTEQRTRAPLLIIFLDLSRFFAQSQRLGDEEIAETLDEFYERVDAAVRDAGGTTVKFIGDAALVVFSEQQANAGIEMLFALEQEVDALLAERGWECRLSAKVHFGEVVAGPFGAAGEKRFDVIGRAVNATAVLESRGITLSVDAFRKLTPELRQRFRKHTPPVTYIRLDDPRPGRRAATRGH